MPSGPKSIAAFADGSPPEAADDYVFERAGVTYRIPFVALQTAIVAAFTSAAIAGPIPPEPPEDPEEPMIIPGPIGPQGPQGPPGGGGGGAINYVFLLPDEPEEPTEPFLIPGVSGLDGTSGAPGPTGPAAATILPDAPEEPSEPMMIPGPIGPQGSAGGGGSINILRTTTVQTINAGAGVFTDITGLTFPVVAGTRYAFKFYIVFQSTLTTTGWKASVNCPGGTLDHFSTIQTVANAAAGVATWLQKHNTVRDDMMLLTSTIAPNVDLVCIIEGRYICTVSGTFAARFANELDANNNITISIGSWGIWF